jgi:hypothetical protein
MYRLLIRVDQIINDLDQRRRHADESARVNTILETTSRAFAEELPRVLRRIPIDENHPSTKLTISLPPNFDSYKDMLHTTMTVTVTGPTRQIFSPQLSSSTISWREFETALGENDIALSWRDAVEFMVAASVFEKEASDLDQVLLSSDESRILGFLLRKAPCFLIAAGR